MSRNIKDAVPVLQEAWAWLSSEWPKRHPSLPVPFLTEVYRSPDKQRAYFAQGRQPLVEVNRLRRVAGLAAIGEANNKIITRARPGQSKHESKPSKAFDIAFIKAGTRRDLDWTPSLFANAFRIISERFPTVKWGGHFRNLPDSPHFEI
jgi:hypothetical protein